MLTDGKRMMLINSMMDLSQVRTQNGPQMMATLRELAMSIMRLTGVKNIAKACRDFAASAPQTLRQLGY